MTPIQYDQTAALLTCAVYALAKNPRVYEKLRAEVLERMSGSERVPGFQDIKEMKYLKAVVNGAICFYFLFLFKSKTS